jgi:phosphomevalonate kinase
MFEGAQKLGLGSSAAVTVAATALALGSVDDREQLFAIASAAHVRAQAGVGSGADIAASVHGGVISYTFQRVVRLSWPRGVTLVAFFTGASANTRELVAAVKDARAGRRAAVDAALAAIGAASLAAGNACAQHSPEVAATGLLAAMTLASLATDQLAAASGVALVPTSVHEVRAVAARLGGTAKTTGAGGGDVAIAVIPATKDVTLVERSIIEAGCLPLALNLDQSGVDLGRDVQ